MKTDDRNPTPDLSRYDFSLKRLLANIGLAAAGTGGLYVLLELIGCDWI